MLLTRSYYSQAPHLFTDSAELTGFAKQKLDLSDFLENKSNCATSIFIQIQWAVKCHIAHHDLSYNDKLITASFRMLNSVRNMTHHFKVARSNNQVVNDIVDLCNQGQDGGLNPGRDQQTRLVSVNVNNTKQNEWDWMLSGQCMFVDWPALPAWGSGPGFSSADTHWKPSHQVQASLWGRPSHTGEKPTACFTTSLLTLVGYDW